MRHISGDISDESDTNSHSLSDISHSDEEQEGAEKVESQQEIAFPSHDAT